MEKVKEHLDDVEKLSCRLKRKTTEFNSTWCLLLDRLITFEVLQSNWGTESDEDLQAHISQLAFLRRYPTLSRDFPSTHEQRVKALDSSTYQEAEALFVTTALSSDQEDTHTQWQRFLQLNPTLVNPEESFKTCLGIVECMSCLFISIFLVF